MDEIHETRWQEFEALGEEQVRKSLGAHLFGEEKDRLARQWLEHIAASRTSEATRRALALASEANDLARAANETASAAATSAALTAAAARTNNIIAALALTAAMIAIVISVIGLNLKH